MKANLFLSLALLTLSGTYLAGTEHCSNGNKFTECGSCEGSYLAPVSGNNIESDPCDDSANPYSVFSGNVMRGVNDLQFWNTPGEMDLMWSRRGVSRIIDAGAPSYFGGGHQWLHNWDAKLSNAGVDSNGRRLIEVRHTNGYTSLFRENIGNANWWTPINGDWRGQDRMVEKITTSDEIFEVTINSGTTLRFYKRNVGSGDFYRLEEVLDQLQNVYTLGYQENTVDKLSKISAPGGEQFFDITWGSSNGLDVITRVTASDGRFVDYSYNELTDPNGGSKHQALWQVDYSDSTFAYYRYNWQSYQHRPLLEEARDPRVASGARIIKYKYRYLFYGMVEEEKNAIDNSVISSRTVDTATDLIEMTFGNGSSRSVMSNFGIGRIISDVKPTAGQTDYTYGGYLNRNLASSSDSNDQKTTYSWREGDFLRATRILYSEGGGKSHVHRKSYTYKGLLNFTAEAPSSGGWYLTRYTRNADGHLTKKAYPDGTSELWTRNVNGDPLTHTLRNSATESWGYNANGLKTSHTGPAKAGEVGATQSWTYYPSGLVQTHTLTTGGVMTYEYNEVGQMTKESYDDGSFITREYAGTAIGTPTGIPVQIFNDLTAIKKYEAEEDTPDVWAMTYDAFGRKETSTDPEGHVTTTDYGDADQGICNTCTTRQSPLKVTSAEGRITRYFYDEAWRPVLVAKLADGDGGGDDYEATATLYGPEGRVLYTISDIVLDNIDPATLDFNDYEQIAPYVLDASWTSYGYDTRGRRTQTTRWDGGVPSALFADSSATGYTTTTTYDGLSNVIKVDAPGNRITEMSYPGSAAVMRQMASQKISPDGGTTFYTTKTTWVKGERTTITDALDRKTIVTYNGRGQVLTTTYPDTSSTSATYYVNGLLEKSIDEEGRESVATYDNYGRQLTFAAPGKARSETFHRVLALGGVSYTLDPTGRRMDYAYDDEGLRTDVTVAKDTADVATTSYLYDGDNNVIQVTDPVGMVTSTSYDLLGRRSSMTVPSETANDLLTTTYTYDTAARSVTVTYPDSTSSLSIRDDLGRTITATNENDETIAYGYYLDTSWMSTLTDARQKETQWTYNDLGQMLTKTYPGTPVEKDVYTYGSVQLLRTHTRPSGKIATYDYDDRNRVTGVEWTGPGLYESGEDQTFSYFIDGRPKAQSNGLATNVYAYETDGDLASIRQTHSGGSWLVEYDHDDAGRLTDLSYPENAAGHIETVTHEHNERGQLARVYNPSTNSALATYHRRSDGLITRLDFEGGAKQ